MVTHDCETPNGEQKFIESLYPKVQSQGAELPLLIEQDGMWFIDYLRGRSSEKTWSSISMIVTSEFSASSSIRSKQIWLIDYYNHSFPDQIHVVTQKFAANQQ